MNLYKVYIIKNIENFKKGIIEIYQIADNINEVKNTFKNYKYGKSDKNEKIVVQFIGDIRDFNFKESNEKLS